MNRSLTSVALLLAPAACGGHDASGPPYPDRGAKVTWMDHGIATAALSD